MIQGQAGDARAAHPSKRRGWDSNLGTTRYVAIVSNDNGDPIRLLHRRSELGYTHLRPLALPDEPEAVSEAEQRELTRQARRRAERQLVELWERVHPLLAALVGELQVGDFGRAYTGELRSLAHVVPVALGGRDSHGLRIVCSHFNRSRGGKLGNQLRRAKRPQSRIW
jgi:hypothetical protein